MNQPDNQAELNVSNDFLDRTIRSPLMDRIRTRIAMGLLLVGEMVQSSPSALASTGDSGTTTQSGSRSELANGPEARPYNRALASVDLEFNDGSIQTVGVLRAYNDGLKQFQNTLLPAAVLLWDGSGRTPIISSDNLDINGAERTIKLKFAMSGYSMEQAQIEAALNTTAFAIGENAGRTGDANTGAISPIGAGIPYEDIIRTKPNRFAVESADLRIYAGKELLIDENIVVRPGRTFIVDLTMDHAKAERIEALLNSPHNSKAPNYKVTIQYSGPAIAVVLSQNTVTVSDRVIEQARNELKQIAKEKGSNITQLDQSDVRRVVSSLIQQNIIFDGAVLATDPSRLLDSALGFILRQVEAREAKDLAAQPAHSAMLAERLRPLRQEAEKVGLEVALIDSSKVLEDSSITQRVRESVSSGGIGVNFLVFTAKASGSALTAEQHENAKRLIEQFNSRDSKAISRLESTPYYRIEDIDSTGKLENDGAVQLNLSSGEVTILGRGSMLLPVQISPKGVTESEFNAAQEVALNYYGAQRAKERSLTNTRAVIIQDYEKAQETRSSIEQSMASIVALKGEIEGIRQSMKPLIGREARAVARVSRADWDATYPHYDFSQSRGNTRERVSQHLANGDYAGAAEDLMHTQTHNPAAQKMLLRNLIICFNCLNPRGEFNRRPGFTLDISAARAASDDAQALVSDSDRAEVLKNNLPRAKLLTSYAEDQLPVHLRHMSQAELDQEKASRNDRLLKLLEVDSLLQEEVGALESTRTKLLDAYNRLVSSQNELVSKADLSSDTKKTLSDIIGTISHDKRCNIRDLANSDQYWRAAEELLKDMSAEHKHTVLTYMPWVFKYHFTDIGLPALEVIFN